MKTAHTEGNAITDGWQLIVGIVRVARIDNVDNNAGLGDGEGEANAERMKLVWNAHDALVKALQSIALSYPTTEEGETLASMARDALNAAGVK